MNVMIIAYINLTVDGVSRRYTYVQLLTIFSILRGKCHFPDIQIISHSNIIFHSHTN